MMIFLLVELGFFLLLLLLLSSLFASCVLLGIAEGSLVPVSLFETTQRLLYIPGAEAQFYPRMAWIVKNAPR